MKFSVVIPTYNYAEYIERSIKSVCEQSEKDFEIIVVDDGSKDNTQEIVERVIDQGLENNIKYIYQENQGVSVARNTGVKNSSGYYIWFLDSDDILLPNAFKYAINFINKNPDPDMFYGGYRANYINVPAVDRYPSPLSGNRLKDFSALLEGKIKGINTGCIVFKRSVFDDLMFDEDVYTVEDFAFFALVIAMKKGKMINELLAEKTRHPDSLRDNYHAVLKTGTKMVDAIFENPKLDSEFLALRTKFLARRLLSLSRAHHRNGEHKQAVEYYLKGLKTNFRVIRRTRYLRCFFSSLMFVLKERLV